MSLQGPLLVVSEKPAPSLVSALGAAGAFPVIEARAAEVASAIETAQPSAIVLAESKITEDAALADILSRTVTAAAPFVPVVVRMDEGAASAYPEALPVAADAAPRIILGRLSAALRVRRRHASVLRRAEIALAEGGDIPGIVGHDPLDDAIVIVAGRNRCYPELAVAVGERVGLIGALSIETAARYLRARDVDGVVIGGGFPAQNIEALLTILAEDSRFRDLPVAVLGEPEITWQEELPGLIQARTHADLLTRFFPFVRMHAFDARLKRVMSSLNLQGVIDPDTGLLHATAFINDLERAMHDAAECGLSLSIARFTFNNLMDRRGAMDAARLVSQLIRNSDFACQEDDGSILVVFTETDLQVGHIVVRRLAAMLKHTMLRQNGGHAVAPHITLATRKSSDNVASLLARVTVPAAAAE